MIGSISVGIDQKVSWWVVSDIQQKQIAHIGVGRGRGGLMSKLWTGEVKVVVIGHCVETGL